MISLHQIRISDQYAIDRPGVLNRRQESMNASMQLIRRKFDEIRKSVFGTFEKERIIVNKG